MDCGQISVTATKNGQHISVKFGLNCDQHLLAAAKYMRNEAESKDVLERHKRLTVGAEADKVTGS
jgi:hypothetical protein